MATRARHSVPVLVAAALAAGCAVNKPDYTWKTCTANADCPAPDYLCDPTQGRCVHVPQCPAALSACGATCVNLKADTANCGACGSACATGEFCAGGTCVAGCAAPFQQCASGAATVCTDPRSDPANCGACGTACEANEVCAAGSCTTSCALAGLTICSGACVDPQTDPANCGACGTACGSKEVCAEGQCALNCKPDRTLCTPDGGASFCASTTSDPANCGACGVVCHSGQACSSSKCGTSCPPGETLCAGDGGVQCASIKSDNANCGACGVACALGQVCSGGSCNTSCPPGELLCASDAGGPLCANTRTDSDNCGSCGVACPAGQICSGGWCAVDCQPNETLCAVDGGAGYCANTKTDNANCGTCGKTCGAGQACNAGKCQLTCAAGLTQCAGACVDTSVDPDNCGGCGKSCGSPSNAVVACVNQACVFGCKPGFADCDGIAGNGCEAPLDANPNCGSCGHTCPSGKCTAQDCTRRVFVTSMTYRPNFGSLSVADADCQAQGAGLGGRYLAWLSDGVSSPSTRFTRSLAPYYLPDGTTMVAANWTSLTSGSLLSSIFQTASGANMGGTCVWTATNFDGSYDASYGDCVSWTSIANGQLGGYGECSMVTSGWTTMSDLSCYTAACALYCFEQ